MKKSFILLFSLLLSLGMQAVNKLPLKVLYVGGQTEMYYDYYKQDPEGKAKDVAQRMAAFEKFLNTYFTTVKVVKAEDWTQDLSKDYDVTVMDGKPKPLRDAVRDMAKQHYSQAQYITEDFDLPMVTIGSIGETIGRAVGVKNDWYCLCLDADAHSWREDHAIFKGPFPVKMTVVEKPTPEDAFHYEYFLGHATPKTLPMWRVQTQGYKDTENFGVGMVARPWGYEDSPEAEYISSGVCAKTLDAVAIGRHGNFLHWGFTASPAYMTEEAKPVLANAIAYIAQFKGKGIIARKYNERQTTLEYLKEQTYVVTRDYYEERQKSNEEWRKETLAIQTRAKEKQAKGEKLTPGEEASLDFDLTPQPVPSFDDHVKRYAKNLYEKFGTDVEAIIQYLNDNKPYLYGNIGLYEFHVDEDCKALGINNHDIRLIDTAIAMLEKNEDVARAKRLLLRYTLCDFATAQQWREWFNKHKEQMFFSESAGWVWLVNTYEPGVNDYKGWMSRQAKAAVQTGETSDQEPVAIAADRQYSVNGAQTLVIKVKIHPGYHLYEYVPGNSAFTLTTVDVRLPEGYKAESKLIKPMGKPFDGTQMRVYEGEITFTQAISGSSKDPITVEITYQCCDDTICFPPTTKSVEVK